MLNGGKILSGPMSPRWLWSGSVLFLLLFAIILVTGARLDFDRERMLQFVGPDELRSASWIELLEIHAQPPGFNAMLKFTDGFGSNSDSILLAIFVVMTFIGIWMAADITYRLSGSVRWGVVAGLLAGGVPGTTYYALWVFYTTPTALLLTAAVWGMVRTARTGSITALTISVVALAAAALMRSSIVWVLVVAWLALNASTIRRTIGKAPQVRRLFSFALALTVLLGLGAMQARAFSAFGSATLSSWGFENAAKALQTTMTEDEIRILVEDDPCLVQVVGTGVFRPINEYPECARASSVNVDGMSPLLTQYYWANGAANMNHIERLVLSDYWLSFTARAITDDPTRVLRIPFPSLTNQERGTIIRFLWPSSWYWLIEKNVAAGGSLTTAWIALTAWVPVAMIAFIAWGLIRTRRLWVSDPIGRHSFRVSSSGVLSLGVIYLFLETGENERFRAEIDWLLIALGVAVLAQITKSRRSLPPDPSRDSGSVTAATPSDDGSATST